MQHLVHLYESGSGPSDCLTELTNLPDYVAGALLAKVEEVYHGQASRFDVMTISRRRLDLICLAGEEGRPRACAICAVLHHGNQQQTSETNATAGWCAVLLTVWANSSGRPRGTRRPRLASLLSALRPEPHYLPRSVLARAKRRWTHWRKTHAPHA